MSNIACGNKSIEVDQDGFLSKTEDWDEEVAGALAEREGICELNREKFDILFFLRGYYHEFSSFPILKYVCKNINAASGSCITDEFVDPMKAWKIAGLPKPPQVFFTSFDGKHFAANPFY